MGSEADWSATGLEESTKRLKNANKSRPAHGLGKTLEHVIGSNPAPSQIFGSLFQADRSSTIYMSALVGSTDHLAAHGVASGDKAALVA